MIEGTDLDLDEVAALTGGNPLFVTEVIAWGADPVPASVRDSVLGGAAKLPPGARRVLDLVSVMPGGADRTVVDAIVAPAAEDVAACERLALLRSEDHSLACRHELVRRAVESELSVEERRYLNQRVLDELTGYADVAVLVHHAREAGNEAAIVEYAPRAARTAMALESYREALGHFEALDPHLDRLAEIDQAALLEARAQAETYVGSQRGPEMIGRAIDLYRSADAEADLARALASAVRLYEFGFRPQDADACAAEAVRLLEKWGPSKDLAFALSQQAWLAMIRGAAERAEKVAACAIGVARQVDAPFALIHSLNTKACCLIASGDNGGFDMLEECERLAQAHGSPAEAARALSNVAGFALQHLDFDRAADSAALSAEMAAKHDLESSAAYGQAEAAEVLALHGEWPTAESMLVDAMAASTLIEAKAKTSLAAILTPCGRAGARTVAYRAWALAQALGQLQYLIPAAGRVAEHLWVSGEEDPKFIEAAHEVLAAAERLGVPVEPLSSGILAFWMWKLGQITAGPDWIAEPYRLVIEGRPVEAAAIWEDKGAPYEQALALMHGDHTDQLRALRMLEDLGAEATAARLRESLHNDGVQIPRRRSMATRRHPAGLTPLVRPRYSSCSAKASPTPRSPTGSSSPATPSRTTWRRSS